MSDSDTYEAGMRTRREVLGDAHVDGARGCFSAIDVGDPDIRLRDQRQEDRKQAHRGII